jgi:alpha-N-arabinofuranosidase
MYDPGELFHHQRLTDEQAATIAIDTSRPAPWTVSPFLYGKFCEHLGANIYQGMDAQILRNPTFGRWPFGAGNHPDGGCQFRYDADAARAYLEHHRLGLDPSDVEAMVEASRNGGALFWFADGGADGPRLSPDVAPSGGRAQRVEFPGRAAERSAIMQQTRLPLHRTRGYECRVAARSPQGAMLEVGLLGPARGEGPPAELARATLAVGADWTIAEGRLEIPADADAEPDGLFTFRVAAAEAANVVFASIMLHPDDHVHGADPDVVAMLKDARLPMLRWPGGNFVSGYHWRDGVGPLDLRPTKPNLAWGGLEYHTFGTDEFIALCRTLECEPLICVNAGDGTADEAAAWVAYCNGAPGSPMGNMRAGNGHPEPYGVRYWEIGNEVHGSWQVHHTTPQGYADRYRRFADAILAVDPAVRLLACGNWPNDEWNSTLLDRCSDRISCITHHCLVGGEVDEGADPDDLFHAFMAYPSGLGDAYRKQLDAMRDAGIEDPTIAVTELQLFARAPSAEVRERIPRPDTIAEALYDAVFINMCIRSGGAVDILTHSATVNHGGGLRKARERVWANPAHHGHVIGRPLAGGTPVPVRVACPVVSTSGPTGGLPEAADMPVLDAMAVLSEGGDDLWVLIVHRSAAHGDLSVELDLGGFRAAASVERVTLAGDGVADANTGEEPGRIAPRADVVDCEDGRVVCVVPRLSLTRLHLRRLKG